MRRLTTNNIRAIILNNRILTENFFMEIVEMNAVFAMTGIVGVLVSIILVRLITHEDGAKSYAPRCQAL